MHVIDSHHHFWRYDAAEYPWISDDMAVLKRDFLPADLAAEAHAADVDAVISVQARQSIRETEDLLAFASGKDGSLISGVVGWVPLIDDKVGEPLDRFSQEKKLVGIRHVLQDEEDDRYMLRDDFNRGVARLRDAGLVYDILIFQKHLPQSVDFVDRHPGQVFVLDHVAKPVIESSTPPAAWKDGIARLAERENVYCKVSGMVTEVRPDQWDPALLRPYWEVVLEHFSPRRLLFGSDWPVCLLRAEYGAWAQTVRAFTADLSPDEQARVLGGTAAEVYGV